ncbi:MAG: hypothetical protein EBT66_10410 [Bacteroidetes bacterium]|nr:hypothetical protein [Bacteroidota bacterium]
MRAAFGILAFASFGTVILVYVFLMVIIPAASTPAEKLQMRGEPVNFDNLAKVVDQNVRSAMENVKPRAKRGLGKTGRLAVKVLAAIALVALFSRCYRPVCSRSCLTPSMITSCWGIPICLVRSWPSVWWFWCL